MMLERGKYSNTSLSGKEFDIYNEIESLKTGQSVKRDLVQTLSNSTGCPKKNGTRINQLCMHLKRNPHKLMLYAL